ncbi:hypothetical protein FJ546_30975, partial [Mesorhizobium sp. B2-4-19]
MTITFDFTSSLAGVTHTKAFYNSLQLEFVTEADFVGPLSQKVVTVADPGSNPTQVTVGPYGDFYPDDVSAYRPGSNYIYSVSETSPFGFKIPISPTGFPDIRTYVSASTYSSAGLDAALQSYFNAWDAWDSAMNQKPFFSVEFGGLAGEHGIFTSTTPITGLAATFARADLMDGDDLIIGSDFADTLDGEGGNDIIKGGTGSNTLNGGGGDDQFIFTGTGFVPLLGDTNTIDGGIGAKDILKLGGSSNDYQISAAAGSTWDTTNTSISKAPLVGPSEYSFNTTKTEWVLFEERASNSISLTGGSLYREMARQMVEVYDENSGPAEARNWHSVAGIEIGLKPKDFGEFAGRHFTFIDGIYRETSTTAGDAVAEVSTGVIAGRTTLSVAFEGSDDIGDFAYDLILTPEFFYPKFSPLVDSIKKYLTENPGKIDQIIVSGHSLGGAMMQYFVDSMVKANFAGTISGFGFASIGGGLQTVANANLHVVNFIHIGDIANNLNLVLDTRGDNQVLINSALYWRPDLLHGKAGYETDVNFLISEASKPLGQFATSSLGSALANGGSWFGKIQISTGTGGGDSIQSLSKDSYVLAGDGDDHISFKANFVGMDQVNLVAEGTRIVEGGFGTDTLILPYAKSSFDFVSNGTGVTVDYKQFIGISSYVATIYGVEFVQCGDQLFRLNGQPLIAQQGPDNDNTFTVDDSFDYSDSGNGNKTVNGTSLANNIYLGSGNQSVLAGDGDDVVRVKSSLQPQSTSQVTIDGGIGADYMVGGSGQNVYVVDNIHDVVVDGGGHDLVQSSVDYTIDDGVEDLQLTGPATFGFGNDRANKVTGNSGNNIIDGLGGADTMQGGLGNDTYYV